MAKYLVVVESPNKCKTINKYLGPDYKVMASFGHIRGIPSESNMVDLTNYQAKYRISKGSKGHVDELVKSAHGKEIIYLCTDPDREGEGIAWHVMDVLKSKGIKGPFKRVVFHEITESAIKEAFKHVRDIDYNLVDAQKARQNLDYLVGFSLSPMLWRSVGKGLSAGRVQSPALKLISTRDIEIQDFKPEEYWSIHFKTEKDHIPFKAKFFSMVGIEGKYNIPNEDAANAVLEKIGRKNGIVSSVKSKEVRRKPKPPFTTSSLQQEAYNKLGFSSKDTMSVAQSLFEKGYITYMRTDSTVLSKEAISSVRDYIQKKHGKDYLYPDVRIHGKKSANAQEAHEAIRPTSFSFEDKNKQDLDNRERKLYSLIWNRTVASQMADAIFDQTQIEILVGDGIFKATGSVVKFQGYLAEYEDSKEDNKEEEENQKLPTLSTNDSLPNLGVEKEQHFTKPPARFNDASLVKQLEQLGIGRPSTYASIIDTLRKREYVEKEAKRMESTHMGKSVSDYLEKHFPQYVSYDFTSHLEESLDEIARGEKSFQEVMRYQVDALLHAINTEKDRLKDTRSQYHGLIEISDKDCPKCGGKLGLRKGKFGTFTSCSNYPKCDYKEDKKKSLTEVGRNCPECQSPLVERKSKKGRPFVGCSNYPTCNYIERVDSEGKIITGKTKIDTGEMCPKCKHHTLSIIKGKFGYFLGCNGYSDKKKRCKNIIKIDNPSLYQNYIDEME